MSHEYIIAEQRGRVGIITFNRPDRLNAMIPEMGIRGPRPTGGLGDR